MRNTIKMFGIIALAAVIGFSMAGCSNPASSSSDGGGGGIPTPNSNVTAFTGVSGSDIIEIINTSVNGRAAFSTSGWTNGNSYSAFINGVPKSSGTATVPGDGTIQLGSWGTISAAGSITVEGKTFTVSSPEDNVYYAIGCTTITKNASDVIKETTGLTAEGVLVKAIQNPFFFRSRYLDDVGDWGGMTAFAKENKCPNSEVTKAANTLNNAVSAWGYYKDPSSGYMVVFFITRSMAIRDAARLALQ